MEWIGGAKTQVSSCEYGTPTKLYATPPIKGYKRKEKEMGTVLVGIGYVVLLVVVVLIACVVGPLWEEYNHRKNNKK